MGQLMRDRRTGKGKEIAGQPQSADRLERVLGEARSQRGEAHQQNCQQRHKRQRRVICPE